MATLSDLRTVLLLLLLPVLAHAQTTARTPNLRVPFTSNEKMNEGLSRIDEVLGPITGGVYDPAHRGMVFDAGGAVFNVMAPNFGARCDGTTDDTIAIQKAENSADDVCGTVFIPATANGCKVTDADGDGSGILVSSCVTIAGEGWGSKLVAGANFGNADLLETAENPATEGARPVNVTIRDLTLDGNKANNSTGGEASMGITLRATVDALVSNVRILNPKGDCVYIGGASTATVRPLRNTVRGVHCSGPARNGIAVVSGHQINILGNHVEDWGFGAIDLELESTADLAVEEANIVGNVMENGDTDANDVGINVIADTAGQVLKGVSVVGNVVDHAGVGLQFRGTTALTVSANTIRNTVDDCIRSASGAAGMDPVGTVITGNALNTCGNEGIQFLRASDITITSNTIRNTAASAIRLNNGGGGTGTGTPTYVLATGNNVTGVDTDASGNDYCISVTATSGAIANNVLRNCDYKGIDFGGGQLTLAGNDISSSGTMNSCIEVNAGTDVLIRDGAYNNCTTKISDSGTRTRVNGLAITDTPSTCSATTNGEQYWDKSLFEACVCNSSHGSGARWCQRDGGGCTSDTSCG